MFRFFFLLLMMSSLVHAQVDPAWTRPFPAHKIAGNLYYVGTEDLACFLLATPQGHILINTGLDGSTPLIRKSIGKLGFSIEDVKILLTMQAHFDHVAAMREIQQLSGARVYATEPDAPVLEDGGKSDPFLGSASWFAPVRVDRRLKDGDTIALGGTELRVILTPGHTKGSVTYATTVVENGRKLSVVLANMGTVVMPLVDNRKYPHIAEDFAMSFEKQAKLSPDIWVAAHASQYGMAKKFKAGSFIDPKGYREAVERYAQAFRKELDQQRGRRGVSGQGGRTALMGLVTLACAHLSSWGDIACAWRTRRSHECECGAHECARRVGRLRVRAAGAVFQSPRAS